MHLNMGHKIFGVAIVVLLLMATVAAFSVRLTAQISNELDLVATKQLPLSHAIGEINVRVLEQSIHFQRILDSSDPISDNTFAKVHELDDAIEAEFQEAIALLELESQSAYAPDAIDALRQSIDKVEQEYRTYEAKAFELMRMHEIGSIQEYVADLPEFYVLQAVIDSEISALRQHAESITDQAIQRADEDEKFLLIFNITMTALSAALGLGLAAIITIALVRNVRRLVSAAEQVENGSLDIEIPVTSRDEVGRLSASFNEMVDGLRAKERIKETFGKYVDPRIVNRLLDDPAFTRFGGDRREMTVMFIDLKGYTSISEKLVPDDLVRMINLFLSHMTKAVANNKGAINDFLGDAVMAYWGPPFTGADEHAALACKAALDAVDNFEQFRAELAEELGNEADGLEINMRIGISTGFVIAGNIGSDASRKFSVLGDPVNLGARLEGANKVYGTRIILSERTQELASESVPTRELDLIRVKGKSEPTRIFELPLTDSAPAGYEAALAAYRAQDWDTALDMFATWQASHANDTVAAVFIDRITHLKKSTRFRLGRRLDVHNKIGPAFSILRHQENSLFWSKSACAARYCGASPALQRSMIM